MFPASILLHTFAAMNIFFTVSVSPIPVIAIAVLLLAIIALLVFSLRKSDRKKQQAEDRFRQLEGKINTLELQTLEAKLNPHLFKNILNSIQSHAYQTYFALDKMANVLDYILYESRNKFVTPKEEIEFAMNLIEINKIKISPLFELKIKTKIDETDPLFEQRLLAPLISIDLIENAFKHADLQSPDAFIAITFEFKDTVFSLTVSNKISSRTPLKKGKGGIGTETLQQRLNIIYKDNFKLERFVEDDVYIAHLKINLLEHKAKMLTA
jgi:LytS/YehU family sensor histidine kinase